MNNTQLNQFKQFFIEKQDSIIRTSANRAEETVDSSGDEADIASVTAIKRLSDQLSKRELDSLRVIEKCLLRIKEGSYGTCEECLEEISSARLKALPYTNLCISCAEEQELLAKIG